MELPRFAVVEELRVVCAMVDVVVEVVGEVQESMCGRKQVCVEGLYSPALVEGLRRVCWQVEGQGSGELWVPWELSRHSREMHLQCLLQDWKVA